MHFSPIEKSDIVIYERLIKVDKKFLYPIKCLKYSAMMALKFKYA